MSISKLMVLIVGGLMALLLIIFAAVKYEQWFDYNCLKSHDEQRVSYSYHCTWRSSNGTCLAGHPEPYYYTVTVCDQWREQK